MNEKLKVFLQEWEQKFPDLNCLTCFRMSKIDVSNGRDSVYARFRSERDKLRCIAPGFFDALEGLENTNIDSPL